MKTIQPILTIVTLLGASIFLTNCKDDDTDIQRTGMVQFEITDGPMDDGNIKGAFVTIAGVKVDGQAISGFSKQTIDLTNYQHGATKALGSLDLAAGSYNQVTLILDYQTDENGNSPGTYVLDAENQKHDLQAAADASNEIRITTGDFKVGGNDATNLVLDFDLRKAIRYDDSPTSDDKYEFASEAELNTAVRFVTKANTGQVKGTYSDNLIFGAKKVVVYAYEKGTYDLETELQATSDGQLQFQHAVTSSVVSGQGGYTLAFLEAGDYELHFISYDDKNLDGKLEFDGEIILNMLTNLDLDLTNLTVEAGASVSITLYGVAILP